MLYPCELPTALFTTNVTNVPNERPFDYMIKARHLDVISPQSNTVVNLDGLTKVIQYVWYLRNAQLIAGLNISDIEIKLGEQSTFYTSIFQEY